VFREFLHVNFSLKQVTRQVTREHKSDKPFVISLYSPDSDHKFLRDAINYRTGITF